MNILLLTQYYEPEDVGPAIWLREIVEDLTAGGHHVTVLTSFPNYPTGSVFEQYKKKVFLREQLHGIEIVRTWIYASPNRAFLRRLLNFGSFSITSLIGGIVGCGRPDVIYAFMPPLTLGVTAVALGAVKRSKVVINIEDIHPHAAVVTGVLKNRTIIKFFEAMEKWIYKYVDHIIVISEGFRENLLSKSVPSNKLSVVPNWADPNFIQPGPRFNSFRQELEADSLFTLIYSGGLTHNSNLEPLLDAAEMLHDEPFLFVIVGEGVREAALKDISKKKGLRNVLFKPFQPLDRYPDILRAADMTLVTLSNQAAFVSVPSKIFKQMAAGRPILAITKKGNELDRLVNSAQCGLCVSPDSPEELVQALRWAADHPNELEQMGQNGRNYLEKYHNRARCISDIEKVLQAVLSGVLNTEIEGNGHAL